MRYIILSAILSIVLLAAFRSPSTFTVSGFVRDSNSGDPIANVLITVKGTKITTSSAVNGSFSITMPSEKATLVFTSIGYASREFKVKGDTRNLSVSLNSSQQDLQEVVVMGYGISQKPEKEDALVVESAKGIVANPAPNSRVRYFPGR